MYLWGVPNKDKARLTTISCLEFLRAELPFMSVLVYENFDALPRRERSMLVNTGDKQYTALAEFKQQGQPHLRRLAA